MLLFHRPTYACVVFWQAKRTPFGTFGGKLKNYSATDLAVHAAQATIADAKVSVHSPHGQQSQLW